MSTAERHLKTEEFSKDKEVLLKKLTNIFDPQTAADFVCPKTHETRKFLTIEDLKNVRSEQSEERLQRLRSMEHYQPTTQSLSRADLEASYQAFVRGQMGQEQCSRYDLEQFVRNTGDIDTAKRFLDYSHNLSAYPLQSHLLFHSSKLNEQRAKQMKSASTKKSLKEINDGFTLHEYFPETFITHPKSSHRQREIVAHKPHLSLPSSVHLEHQEKKYRITFLKNSNNLPCLPKLSHYSRKDQNLLSLYHRHTESLFDTESSIVQGLPIEPTASNIHREIFPPLSLSALREYRPTLIPNSPPASTSRSETQQLLPKKEFIWEQSIVSLET